jgi:hypothetical protein
LSLVGIPENQTRMNSSLDSSQRVQRVFNLLPMDERVGWKVDSNIWEGYDCFHEYEL